MAIDLTNLGAQLTLALTELGPVATASMVQEIIDKLKALKAALLTQAQSGALRDAGGVSDRVRMKVIGPDGNIKQEIDTLLN